MQEEEKSGSKSVVAATAALLVAVAAGGGMAWLSTQNKPPQIDKAATSPPNSAAVDPNTVPEPAATIPPTDLSPTTIDGNVKVFWVDKTTGERIKVAPEERKIARANIETPSSLVKKSLTILLSSSGKEGKNGTEVSTIPPTTKLLSSKIKPDGIHIDLSKEFMNGGGSTSMQGRLAQILYTATERNTKAKVWISVEGKKLESLGGEGIEVKQPLTRKTFQQDYKDSVGEQ